MKTLLVCGGRDYADSKKLAEAMRRCVTELGVTQPSEMRVIHGAARGADRLAGMIARASNVLVVEFPADWDTHGKRAGFLRNAQMLREGEPDLVLAAPGGRGTADMVRQAQATGVRVLFVDG